MERIFALSTAPGRSGVAVLRVSGAGSRAGLARLCGELPESGRSLRLLRDDDGDVIDQALVLIFPEGASFTGEEVVELHVHGSMAVIRRLLRWLGSAAGFRQADAGEFTRRALQNGRLDFAQVEGLADLIDAETEAQRRQSIRLMSGELGRKVVRWRSILLEVQALLAASLDFADEGLAGLDRDRVEGLITSLQAELLVEADGARAAERIRDGFVVAIVGRPNVGKSTLLNRLAARDIALTSPIPGTTRDVLEVRMDIGGFPVTVLDTAGLRVSDDHLERLGIEMARKRASSADIRIHLTDEGGVPELTVEPGDIVLQGKGDLFGDRPETVSGLTGAGVDGLLAKLETRLSEMAAPVGSATRERHRTAMVSAAAYLAAASEALKLDDQEELVSEDARLALRALEGLVARVETEEVLGWVFSRFCIGK